MKMLSIGMFLLLAIVGFVALMQLSNVKDFNSSLQSFNPWPACNCKSEEKDHFIDVGGKDEALTSTPGFTLNPEKRLIAGLEVLEYYREVMLRRVTTFEKKTKKKMYLIQPYRTPQNLSMLSAFEFPDEYQLVQTAIGNYGANVFCRYFAENGSESGQPFQTFLYTEYVAHCPKRAGTKFIALSIGKSDVIDYPVPLVDRTRQEPTHFFGVCLAPMYGAEPKWLMLSELIEHYKLQGATHFYVYLRHIDHYSRHILNDYVRTGEVEVVHLLERFYRIGDNWQHIGIQDCTLRSRGFSKWNAFVDLDERLVMTDYAGTISQFLREINDTNVGSVQFRQKWILKNELMPKYYANDTQVLDWMPTNRFHNTSSVGAPGHTAKCIVDTQKAFLMWVHYVSEFYPGFKNLPLTPEQGVVRHYRDIQLGNWGASWLKSVERFGKFSPTDYPSKYFSRLQENVLKRVRYVYNNPKMNETHLAK